MNPLRLLLTLSLLLTITACKGQSQSTDADPTDPASMHEQNQQTMEELQETSEGNTETFDELSAEDMQGHNEDLGIKTLKGKLRTTKGAQPIVEGVLISTDFFEEEGKSWHEKVESLEGKTVVITGQVNRHWCGPMEQCMSDGYIDSMQEVDSFEVK